MNLLFISIDSLRADFALRTPESTVTMPFLSSISDQLTTFANAISPSTWTLPVHGSIFTGLYPPEHGVRDKGDQLGATRTLAQKFDAMGYDTVSYAGNGWLNTGEILRGFDHHHITPPWSRHWVDKTIQGIKNKRISEIREGITNLSRSPIEISRDYLLRNNLHDTRIVRRYSDHLSRSEQPFFHFIHLNGVHNPYTPHINHYKKFGQCSYSELKDAIAYQNKLINDRPLLAAEKKQFDTKYTQIIQELYCGTIYRADRNIKLIIEQLRDKGCLGETVIIIFGDHGDHLGEGNLWGHQFSVQDEIIRVPLFIIDPLDKFNNTQRDDIVQLNDLYPTVLDIVGADYSNSHSYSLQEENRETAFTYYSTPNSYLNRIKQNHSIELDDLPPVKQFAAWRDNSTRGTWYPDAEHDEGDPSLRGILKKHHGNLDRIETVESKTLDRQTKRNLKDMGYL